MDKYRKNKQSDSFGCSVVGSHNYQRILKHRGYAVALLLDVLRYQPEG